MPTNLRFSVTVALLGLACPAFSQRIVSPEVQPDHRVTFRLKAPDAKEVKLHCEGVNSSAMTRDDQGVWSLTTDALEPDIYSYSFVVDGVRAIDPGNPGIKYNLLNIDSQVHVPGPATLPWEINDVPHGQLHRHFYHSAVAGHHRDFYVYTPPDYDPSLRKRYPVLYLLHGYSDDATAWTAVGYAHVILDNLIARKLAKPMLVVMPLGYGAMDVLHGGWGGPGWADLWRTNLVKFRETLTNEVMPRVEQTYHIFPQASAHAIAGLSMGGAESLLTGLNAPERFGWIGAFSSGGLGDNLASEFPALDERANAPLRLLWIACGEQDGLLGANQKLSDWLKSKGVRHTWVHTPGEHSFRVWRRNLADFAPLLFKENRQE